jgi:hypothetical protein
MLVVVVVDLAEQLVKVEVEVQVANQHQVQDVAQQIKVVVEVVTRI